MVRWVGFGGGGVAKKHGIYAAAFGGHLFYDLFSQGHGPSAPPGSATANAAFSRGVTNLLLSLMPLKTGLSNRGDSDAPPVQFLVKVGKK